ncbi:hypothetical protein PILCRDRAFT_531553 [Piloderma croceum F 1598]|uniref:Uncharacterized protein n=1 Tax=Piloderma croceum (strain F 1598) TaxID=765440 RepID=A0A0C3FLJ1_PILCF|nr:hypothetical protein PILCRDRAFT_531553 [Piloderma croceum F 1598]
MGPPPSRPPRDRGFFFICGRAETADAAAGSWGCRLGSGLTFVSRFQGVTEELRDGFGAAGVMNGIHDTLGGSLPSNLPQHPAVIPFRPIPTRTTPSTSFPGGTVLNRSRIPTAQYPIIPYLPRQQGARTRGVIPDHDAIKRKTGLLRQLVEKSTHQQRDWEQERFVAASGGPAAVDGGDSADVDDARSIRTIVPHEFERVEEKEDEVCRAR